jgi:MerR family transcriptional regulator, thiopeptide resistance regulator
MSNYTVKQLARLSGVSVRALHHYDEIGLLKPAFLGENRYRYYGREELLRLQDILFHRELGVPLQEIGRLLEHDGRDRLTILSHHREMLAERLERSRQLLTTIDRTIAELNGAGTMKDSEIYAGFSPEKQAEHEQWLVGKYGGAMQAEIDRGKARLADMSEEQRKAALAEGAAAEDALVEDFKRGLAPDNSQVEPSIARHHAWITSMWGRACAPVAYAGLTDLYLSHPGFIVRYEARAAGFTDWLAAAMKAYAGRLSP